jgi:hypothetical protein
MDPETGSLWNPLSEPRYFYAQANPMLRRDPSGRDSLVELAISLAIGVGVDALYNGAVVAAKVAVQTSIGYLTGSYFGMIVGFMDGWMTTDDLDVAFQESEDASYWGGVFGALEGAMNAVMPCAFQTAWNIGWTIYGVGSSAVAAGKALANGDPMLAMWKASLGAGALFAVVLMARACFVAGTPLLTPQGHKRIEDFETGDLILARDETNPEAPVVARRVVQTFRTTGLVLRLNLRGRIIETTGEHPFWVVGSGWKEAKAIRKGDLVLSHGDQDVLVQEVEQAGRYDTVYNVEVEHDHTYFVGATEWGWSAWAHNAACRSIQNRPPHGDSWHNPTGTGLANQLELQFGRGNVRWNQNLVNPQGVSIPGRRPDIQYITGGKVHIIEFQSLGQSPAYMNGLGNSYRTLLGADFGSYTWVPRP